MSRAEAQEHNRGRVLAAARAEFTERGFRDAKIDVIAERADLTRGAVYSNFPGKRALYFAVLADDADRRAQDTSADASPEFAARTAEAAATAEAAPTAETASTAGTAAMVLDYRTSGAALAAFARAWLARLPMMVDDERATVRLGADLLPEILADQQTRRPFAQLMELNAILLGLSLENLRLKLRHPARRLVPLAGAALTTLHGASQLAAAAPGFVDEFAIAAVCEHLADLDLDTPWDPPHLALIPPALPVDLPWTPPPATDVMRREPAPLTRDGVVAILGLHRLGAIEEALRATPANAAVTAVLVTGEPDELGPLARLVVAETRACLHEAFPRFAWPRLRIVHDESGALAAAAGVTDISDDTMSAVRISAGRLVARADGYGACHAAAVA